MNINSVLLFLGLSSLFCLAGCNKSALYLNESFDVQEVDRIAVMPLIDNRLKPNPKHDFVEISKTANGIIVSNLMYSRGYRASQLSDLGSVSSYTIQDLPNKTVDSNGLVIYDPHSFDLEWVKALGHPDAKWLLVPVLEDLTTKIITWVVSSSEVTLYLFSKETGELCWIGNGKGGYHEGILMAPIMAQMVGDYYMEKVATEYACMNALKSLPRTGKKIGLNYETGCIDAKEIDTIYVFPVVDARHEHWKGVNFLNTTSGVQKRIFTLLKNKGYESIALPEALKFDGISIEQLYSADKEFIQKLGPSDARWVLVPCIEGLSRVGIANYTDIKLLLFDKESKQLIWESKAFGTTVSSATSKAVSFFPKI